MNDLSAQSGTIVLLFLMAALMPSQGPVFWLFGGFLMLLVLTPLLLFLTVKQLWRLWDKWRDQKPIDWQLERRPWIVLLACFLLYSAGSVTNFFDPFADDAYQIKVDVYRDGRCLVYFNGETTSEVLSRNKFSKDKKGEVYCSTGLRGSKDISVLINYTDSFPGTYPLTSETDSNGYPVGNGGAYFDYTRGAAHNPGVGGTVYWDFVSGTMTIPSPRDPTIFMTLDVIAKRHHRGF